MRFIRIISVVIFAALIFLETIGVQLIKDICLPCNSESIAIQIAYANNETECEDSCQANTPCEETTSCGDCDHGHSTKHEHEKEVQVLSQVPQFVKFENSLDLKFFPVLLTVFNLQLNAALPNCNKTSRIQVNFALNLPITNFQEKFCTYII